MDTDDGLSWKIGDSGCTNCIGKRRHLLMFCLSHDSYRIHFASSLSTSVYVCMYWCIIHLSSNSVNVLTDKRFLCSPWVQISGVSCK